MREKEIADALNRHEIRDEESFKMLKEKMNSLQASVRRWGIVGGFVGGLAGAGMHMLGGCASSLPGKPSNLDLAVYSSDMARCIEQFTIKSDIDQCRESRKSEFCSHFPTLATCMPDGGSHE